MGQDKKVLLLYHPHYFKTWLLGCLILKSLENSVEMALISFTELLKLLFCNFKHYGWFGFFWKKNMIWGSLVNIINFAHNSSAHSMFQRLFQTILFQSKRKLTKVNQRGSGTSPAWTHVSSYEQEVTNNIAIVPADTTTKNQYPLPFK